MKAIRILVACGILALATHAASASDAPGSDCAKLSAPNEKAVCGSRALTKLDTRASTLLEVRMMLPMLMGERGAAQDDNLAFTEKRTACGADAACLQTAYTARISALTDTIKTGMDEFCKLKGIC
jgi:uncharacterized protein